MNHIMIKDLEASKALDTHAMQAVRGGADLTSTDTQLLISDARAGIAAVSTAIQTLVDVNTLLNVDASPNVNINIGGIS